VIAYEANGVLRSGNVFLSNENDSPINESILCRSGDRGDDASGQPVAFQSPNSAIENRSNFAREGLRTLVEVSDRQLG